MVSIRTGEAISDACDELGHNASKFILDKNSIDLILKDLKMNDFVFIALHGSFGEDGAIQSILSKNNIPFNGSDQDSSQNCFSKSVAKEIVMKQGILSPKYYKTSSNMCNDHIDFNSEKYIVKPNSQGSSVGFNIVNRFEQLNDAIDIALDFDSSVLIEEFIDGREITVPILGDKPLPVIEIEPKSGIYDYKSKYTAGESKYICPANLDSDKYQFVQDCALSIHNMLKCDVYSRVDFKFFKNNFYFLEINTLPGMTETSLFPMSAKRHGFSFKNLINKIIKLSLQKWA